MLINQNNYLEIVKQLQIKNIGLVAVSKTKPVEAIKELYELGQRDFGENYVQELVDKEQQLPKDIRWHFIGHLQSNKVKFIAPFVYLIHGIDSFKLLKEVNKQAEKNRRVINVLLQVHIAEEETKFGLDENELRELLSTNLRAGEQVVTDYTNVRICGLMGMASFTDNISIVRSEFKFLKSLFDKYFIGNNQSDENFKPQTSNTKSRNSFFPSSGVSGPSILSMGMSADYKIAIEQGSNMVRIGSLLFGNR